MIPGLEGLPNRIGRYEPTRLVARGGMGRVITAHDSVLNRTVALKLVEPGELQQESSAELRFMFHREARATAALRHPGIIEVYDYSGPDADILFIACEFIEAPTLRAVLERRRQLSPRLLAALGHELALALDHAHGHHIIHRDLKPENIFWPESGRIILADFGIAKALDGSNQLGGTVQFGTTNVYGSPAYMAPEQLRGEAVGPHTDVHALGAVLFEGLTGRQAYDGDQLAKILEALESDDRPAFPPNTRGPGALRVLISEMLAKDPQSRPASARDVAHRLRQILDSLEVTDPRDILRDSGEETALIVPNEEDLEPTEIFAEPPNLGIHVPPSKITKAPGRLSALVARGPVFLGMLGVSLFLGAATYLFTGLSELPSAEDLFLTTPTPTVVVDPSQSDNAGEDGVFVLLRFPGEAEVSIDHEPMGNWESSVRLSIPAGKHKVDVHFPTGTSSREILLIGGTSPVFDFEVP